MDPRKTAAPSSTIARLIILFALAFGLQGMTLYLFPGEEVVRPVTKKETSASGPLTFHVITYTITTQTDGGDVNLGDGICADAEGNCSLRAAIEECNAFGQPCGIIFDIPGTHPSGVITYTTGTLPLPEVTIPARIDGTTQPGHDIHIDYSNLTSGHGLVVNGTNGSVISGLGLYNAPFDCIVVNDAPNTTISSNRLVGCGGNYGVRVSGEPSAGTIISNNVMKNSPGGFRLEYTMTITATNNVIGPVSFFGGDAEGSSNLWILGNEFQGVSNLDGFASFGGVSNVWLNGNTFDEIGRHGISAFRPTTGLNAGGNTFSTIGSMPIYLESGVNEDIPPPRIHEVRGSGSTITVTLSTLADPVDHAYPLNIDAYLNEGNSWGLLGSGLYESSDYPNPRIYVFQVFGDEVPFHDGNVPASSPTEFVEAMLTSADGNSSMMSIDHVALPVELLSFDAIVDGRDVVLSWSSALEYNSAGFEVQQLSNARPGSGSGATWEVADFIPARGIPHSYTYRMEQLDPGSYSFRLRMVDLDGSYSMSPRVEVQIEVAEAYELSATYPNPFNPTTRFTLAVSQEQHVKIALFDLQGRRLDTVFDGRFTAHETYPFELDGSTLASGLYVLRVTGETFDVSRSVTLVK